MITGKILHLDGDKKYSQKAYIQYKKMGLNAMVKNIPEYKQPTLVYKLLKIYTPDILVITGHDGIIKKAKDYNNIYNYRNSKYFIETVKEARRYDEANGNKLVIFAGACQSYYEALILAGANFASSPARILIDLKIYTPDILVITGHDGIIKKAKDYNNIYNYRNSKYFIETVKEARRYDEANGNKLVIFAGACQSYYEALILAGANFASSPARILIDFIDPIIVAEKVAYTERYKYITLILHLHQQEY